MGGLGFRQLHLFNLAMLAKQLWRIWIHPDKLISQVLKAKYFPNGDVFSATLGSRPSFTWRSILAAQYLFRAGCRWRVGSGSRIRVWFDPWLPRPRSFRPITPAPISLLNLCVSDLVDSNSGDWNVRLVNELFWPQDSDVILGIPSVGLVTRTFSCGIILEMGCSQFAVPIILLVPLRIVRVLVPWERLNFHGGEKSGNQNFQIR
ncbi:UNVERIFIED_CONTAM: putative mitochondrial protein [Sesamum radiatum]|uniref:Mitochondrial protein n=1 Tax=Sesamum radiatum TaxID=300843 RepID=A0AAW2W6C3_SESRA